MENIVFIDANYLNKIAKHLNKNIEYNGFRDALQDYFDGPTRIYYYICTIINNRKGIIASKPLIDWLSYHGFMVRHHAILPDDNFEAERRAHITAQVAIDALSYTGLSASMFFLVQTPEYSDIIKAVAKNHYVGIIDSELYTSHQNLRQTVDKTLHIEDLAKLYMKEGQSKLFVPTPSFVEE